MELKSNEHNYCRVCGLYHQAPPWGKDNTTPSYDICPCCGVEFGYEDDNIASTQTYRKKWLDAGSVWFFPNEKPADWNLEEQLKNVPKEFW